MAYDEDDCLPLSGIQHIAFCERQFALIYVERLWLDNTFTFEGQLMHERTDDPFFVESRGAVLICRSVPLLSRRLGLYGVADVVEFHLCSGGDAVLVGRDGKWRPFPIEYKRGQVKPDDRDMVQLCAQAMCLEEMLHVEVPEGALFYGRSKKRVKVEMTDALRDRVDRLTRLMHELYDEGRTPPPNPTRACRPCSLKDLCLPEIAGRKNVRKYVRAMISTSDGGDRTV